MAGKPSFDPQKSSAASPAPLPSPVMRSPQAPKVDAVMQPFQQEQAQPLPTAPSLSGRVSVGNPDAEPLAEAGSSTTPQTNFNDWQELLYEMMVQVLLEQTEPSLSQNPMVAALGKRVNESLKQLNEFFEKLTEQEKGLTTWVKGQEFFQCHPLAVSHQLTLYLEKSSLLAPHLDRDQVARWKGNYQQAVLLLKQNGLNAYVETEFPFDETLKDQIDGIKKSYDNPEFLKQTNPVFYQLTFFRKLDQQLTAHPQDKTAVDAWLQSERSKPNYDHHFYYTREMLLLPFMAEDPSTLELKTLYESCAARLKALGLGHYCGETLPPRLIMEKKLELEESKDSYQKVCEEGLVFFRSLSQKLKQLPAEAPKESKRQTLRAWFVTFKARENYNFPFYFCPMLKAQAIFLKDILDESDFEELQRLEAYCRQQLAALGLSNYLRESPIPIEVPISERFKRETSFFKQLLQQDEKTFETWLQDNSPQHDYPLLWGKKRLPKVEDHRDTVDFDLRREWKESFEACQARLSILGLQAHLNTSQTPTDASLQLRAFINPYDLVLFMADRPVSEAKSQPLVQSLQAALQDPLAAPSLELNKHLRFYLNRYPQIVEKLIPPPLLEWRKAAFGGALVEDPSPPTDATVQTAVTFFMMLLRKNKEGNESALRWISEQKASGSYAYPLYHALYWQTLTNVDERPKLKTLAEFYKLVVDWAYLAGQTELLLETPPGHQGISLLVHRLTEHLVEPSTKAAIVKLVPRMAPLLEKNEMFSYWVNVVTQQAKMLCEDWINLYTEIQTKKNKKEIITFLSQLKLPPHNRKTIDFISKDNVQKIALLAPILPRGLAEKWKITYDSCCAFIRSHGISDDVYINVKAPAFFSENQDDFKTSLETGMQTVSLFFEDLETAKDADVKAKILKMQKEKPNLAPFRFARELDDLCTGMDVKLDARKLKKFKETFGRIQEKLKRLGLEKFLAQPAPIIAFHM